MTDDIRPPRDDLYRAMQGGITAEDGKTLTIRLAPADQWAEIESRTEGHFMERFSRSAYKKTMAEHLPKILLNHGKDPQLGEKPIATTDEAGEDETSPYARGQLLDGVPEMVVDGLRKGVYGASHRFSVVRESWVDKPLGGAHNPNRLPERTITEARLFELGPVTWPAYVQASVSLRSITDEMRPTPTDPVAPSLDAEAETPHVEPERRDEPETPIAAPKEVAQVADQFYSEDEYRAAIRECNDMIERDAQVPGKLPDAAQAAFDEAVAKRSRLQDELDSWLARKAQLPPKLDKPANAESSRYSAPNGFGKPAESDIYDIEAVERSGRTPEQRGQMYRDNAMRAVETMTFPHPDTDVELSRDRIATILDYHDTTDHQFARRVAATNSPLYQRAFNKLLLGQSLTPEEQRGTALAVGVDGTGGFSVPLAFDPTVVAIGVHTGAINPYRRACRVVPIVGTDTWNALTATVVTATRTTEAAAAIEQGPTFAQPQYIVHRVQAQVTYSLEMAADRSDIASEMAVLINEAKDNEEEASFAIGVGSTVTCIGVLAAYGTSGAYTQMDTIGSTVLAAADAYAVEAALPIRHRMSAQWFMNRKTIRAFQALETTGGILFGGNGGYPAVGSDIRNDTQGNTGLRLLGYPVNESPSAPVATTSHIIAAALIAPSSYVIVERVGMTVRIIPDIINSSALATGQSALYAMWRNHAAPLNVDAGRLLDYKT